MRYRRAIGTLKVDPRNWIILWILLVLLTAIILMYPVRLVFEYRPIQAPYIFQNLPFFLILFSVWMIVLIVLAFKRDVPSRPGWEHPALASVFGLVFLGLWVVITPYGSAADDLYNTAHVKWLMANGTVAVDQGSLGYFPFSYFNFPGMHLCAAAISSSTGLTIFQTRTLFLVFNAMLFPALLYLLFLRILASSRLAFLGILLALMGSVLIVDRMRVFFPSTLGFTLLVGFIVLLSRSEGALFGSTLWDRLAIIVLFGGMVVTYLPTSLLVILVILGIYAVQVVARERDALGSLPMISLFLAILLAWEVTWAVGNLRTYAPFFSSLWESVTSAEFVMAPLSMARANTGASLPLWANATRFTWWAVVILGTVLGLYSLTKVRSQEWSQRVAVGGLLGVLVLSLLGLFGTEGGYELQRFLMYGPLLCIPILLGFVSRSVRWRRIGIVMLTSLVVVLAVPTLLSSVNTVSTDAIYVYDLEVGEFLSSMVSDDGEQLDVYGVSPESVVPARYYVQKAEITVVPGKFFFKGDAVELWRTVHQLLSDFEGPSDSGVKQRVLITSESSFTPYQHLLGVSADDQSWAELNMVMSTTSLIYNSGHASVCMR